MTLTRHLASGLVLVLLTACGGSDPAPMETINVWLCGGIECATTRCADKPTGGALQCNAYMREWQPLPQGRSCSPPDCTIAIDAADHCIAVVSCPVR